MSNLLFIDDDTDILRSNQKYFRKEGYRVETADSPETALSLLKRYSPDCIILDVMLPSMSGFELLPKIRSITHAPVIFLSGRTGESDKVNGLMAGGADYVVKPYSMRELSARIQVQVRGTEQSAATFTVSYPPFTLDVLNHKFFYHNTEITLSNIEYQLLYLLLSTPNKPVAFEKLGKIIWGYYTEEGRKTIMVNISRLRKKLRSYTGMENVIETVWSIGYKFAGSRRSGE